MKYLRADPRRPTSIHDSQRRVSLLFTREYTIDNLVYEALMDTPQCMLYQCGYAIAASIINLSITSLNALLEIGTDVNAEYDHNIMFSLDIPHYYEPFPTHLEVAIECSEGYDNEVITPLLHAGAKFTLGVLRLMIHYSDGVRHDILDAHINANNHYYSHGDLEDAVECSDIKEVARLLDQGAIMCLGVFECMVKGECSQEITDLILKHINQRQIKG